MSDFINKIISITLVFMMLVLAPLLISYTTNEMMAKRLILNDVTLFIDRVKDVGSITEEDLNKLFIACNSHGMAVNVKVRRLIRTNVPRGGGEITVVYYSLDRLEDLIAMNAGDIVKVTVSEIGISRARRMIYSILRIDEGPFNFSLAGAVG